MTRSRAAREMQQQPLEHEGSRREFLEVLAEFDVPAYVRRAKRTHDAFVDFVDNCRRERDHQLEFPKMRIAMLAAIIDSQWSAVDELATLPDCEVETIEISKYLSALHEEWNPTLRIQVAPTNSRRRRVSALGDLIRSFESFNRKWNQHLVTLDFTQLNSIRDDYNNYFVCEKAAALQSEQLAAHGFERLPPVGVAEIASALPSLFVPQLR